MDRVNKSKKRVISKKKKGVKVVYISTPMKVQTSASNFRDLVQHLTGRHSDTDRFMFEDGSNLDRALLQTSSEESFADEPDSLVLQPWEESLFPFSSLFVEDHHSNVNYYHPTIYTE